MNWWHCLQSWDKFKPAPGEVSAAQPLAGAVCCAEQLQGARGSVVWASARGAPRASQLLICPHKETS